jgi:4-nitrophenyl phosphatase
LNDLVERVDKTVDLVVFGYDFHMNYYKLCMACFHIQHGAKFIGTNPDSYTMNMGYKLPGNGSMLKSVETATSIRA